MSEWYTSVVMQRKKIWLDLPPSQFMATSLILYLSASTAVRVAPATHCTYSGRPTNGGQSYSKNHQQETHLQSKKKNWSHIFHAELCFQRLIFRVTLLTALSWISRVQDEIQISLWMIHSKILTRGFPWRTCPNNAFKSRIGVQKSQRFNEPMNDQGPFLVRRKKRSKLVSTSEKYQTYREILQAPLWARLTRHRQYFCWSSSPPC